MIVKFFIVCLYVFLELVFLAYCSFILLLHTCLMLLQRSD